MLRRQQFPSSFHPHSRQERVRRFTEGARKHAMKVIRRQTSHARGILKLRLRLETSGQKIPRAANPHVGFMIEKGPAGWHEHQPSMGIPWPL